MARRLRSTRPAGTGGAATRREQRFSTKTVSISRTGQTYRTWSLPKTAWTSKTETSGKRQSGWQLSKILSLQITHESQNKPRGTTERWACWTARGANIKVTAICSYMQGTAIRRGHRGPGWGARKQASPWFWRKAPHQLRGKRKVVFKNNVEATLWLYGDRNELDPNTKISTTTTTLIID